MVVVDPEKTQVIGALERSILAADPIDLPNQMYDVAGPVPVPDFVLVHLGVEVDLAVGVAATFAQLETVLDAVD